VSSILQSFAPILLEWYRGNARNLPWVGEKDPYKVWLSEVIMQQTKVEQGLQYYEKFIKTYPNVESMASADEGEVMTLWEGLGYYSRARNMHHTATVVANEHKGVFPDSPDGLARLKGIGPYTARAIASFAFDQPYAVTDGNVYRILSRVFGMETFIDSTKGKKEFQEVADQLIDKKNAAIYNQAMMDFGSLVCSPKNPDCKSCPFVEYCLAFRMGKVDSLPMKSKKLVKQHRNLHFLVLREEKKVVIEKRIEKDIWKHLYQFPVIEDDRLMSWKELLEGGKIPFHDLKPKGKVIESKTMKQQLTHRVINARFFIVDVNDISQFCRDNEQMVDMSSLDSYPFPEVIRRFLKEFIYF